MTEMIAQTRYWQNWDKLDAAKKIDNYWIERENGWREQLVADVAKHFTEHSPLLEVGCGSGLIYGKMVEHHVTSPKSYTGGDISNNMLKLARERFTKGQFVSLDIFDLPYHEKSQDNVINIHVLQHLPDYEDALRELIRITKKKLYITCWFTTGNEDEIEFSPTSDKWGVRFHNNKYSLPKFINFLISESNQEISDIIIHHFHGANYSIFMSFK